MTPRTWGHHWLIFSSKLNAMSNESCCELIPYKRDALRPLASEATPKPPAMNVICLPPSKIHTTPEPC